MKKFGLVFKIIWEKYIPFIIVPLILLIALATFGLARYIAFNDSAAGQSGVAVGDNAIAATEALPDEQTTGEAGAEPVTPQEPVVEIEEPEPPTEVKNFVPEGGTFAFDATGIEGQPYIVLVNRAQCCITVYGKDKNGNYTKPERAFACSVGRSGHSTPRGRYETRGRYEWCYMVDQTWGRYAIDINGKGIMFHSVCYYTKAVDDLEYDEFNKLGEPASLGCIRLSVGDVFWLYENCPDGFTTIIYDDPDFPGPLGKPETIKIDTTNTEMRKWDPTDVESPYFGEVR